MRHAIGHTDNDEFILFLFHIQQNYKKNSPSEIFESNKTEFGVHSFKFYIEI